MAKESLKNKTVKGVAWSGIDNIAQYVVSFAITIVLARLLSPEDYGLLGIITIFTSICATFLYCGFPTALIRKKDATDEDFNTVFITNLATSLILYVAVFFLSPIIADFFNRQELVLLTRVTSLGLIIGAFSLVQQTRLTKRIDFKTQTKITIASSTISGLVGIVLAFVGFGVWALVAQSLLIQLIRTILLWFYNKWIPKLLFSTQSFRDLFGFGWKMMVSALLSTVWQQLTQVVVGKFYSPASLGQYTRAKQFSDLLSNNLTNVVERVSFPVLSSIQDERPRMLQAYRKILKVTMFVSSISMLFLCGVSEPLIYCLIGPKWHEAATYLPLICLSASTFPLHSLNLNLLEIEGRSDLFLGLDIVKKAIAVGPLFIGAFWGIIPMLYANLITTVINIFLNSFFSGKFIGYNSWMQLKDVAPSYIIAMIIVVSVFFLKYLPLSFWIIMPFQFLIGFIVFIIVNEKVKLEEYVEIKNLLKPQLYKISILLKR